MGTTYLEITWEQASTLYKDVQIFTDWGEGGCHPWWTPEMCREPSHSYRDPSTVALRDMFKWYIEVSNDSCDLSDSCGSTRGADEVS